VRDALSLENSLPLRENSLSQYEVLAADKSFVAQNTTQLNAHSQ
jgi:hypothetical protein